MNVIHLIKNGRLEEAKQLLFAMLDEIVFNKLEEAKRYVAADNYEVVIEEETLEEAKRNPNIIKMGRITKIRRRIRRNAKGRIVVQKNVRRSGIKGFRISGNTVKRIPAAARLKKARL